MQDIISILKYKTIATRGYLLIALLVCLLSLAQCSVTRHVPEDKLLLRSNKIELNSDKKAAEKSELKEQLESITLQKPNTYLFGIWPYKVWLYNLRYQKYTIDSTNYQLESRTVEPPAILDTTQVRRTKELMSAHLFNVGYFHSNIATHIDTQGRKATVRYEVNTGERYLIRNIEYEVPDSTIAALIQKDKGNSLLKLNQFYSNTTAGEERSRLVELMRAEGYYNFTAENIRFELDTIRRGEKMQSDNLAGSFIDILIAKRTTSYEIDVKIIVEDNESKTSFLKYRIGNVIVYMNMHDTMRLGPLYQQANRAEVNPELQIIYDGPSYIARSVLERKILIKPGAMYSQTDYDQTIRSLTDLFVFQYVRIRYSEPTIRDGDPRVNVIILLAPSKKFEYSFNTEVSGGDIYVLGGNINTSITYNNIFRTANQLVLSGSAGIAFEGVGRNRLQLFSQTIGANARLVVPGLLFANKKMFGDGTYTRTVINAGLNYLDRADFFFLRNINVGITYQINRSENITWNIRPAFVSVLNLSNISQQFQERIDSIPAIRNAYQPVFIEGEGIEWIYNSPISNHNQKSYLRLGVEEGGALLSLINQAVPIGNFARYLRFDFDARKYFINNFSTMILRLYGGVGLPYGTSTTLPYIRQYFVGGAYSIRGWRPRVLGPGSYLDPKYDPNGVNNLFIDQAGDIKLELNAEYRFVLARMFANAVSINGAVFADAGNIWLAKEDAQLPNAEFKWSRLGQDIAVSGGLGFRIDFGGFLVLRLDYALQLKKPYEQANYGWTINQIKLGDPVWRRNNSNLNIAIGYPF